MGVGEARRSRVGRAGAAVIRGAFALLIFILVMLLAGRAAADLRERETAPPPGTVALANLTKENP